MWQSPRPEGFIELEQEFARLVRIEGGKKWSARILTSDDGNIWNSLKNEIPHFFPTGTQLNFISSEQGGVRSIDFPQEASEAEILGNLQLKRKEYFNAREEMLFNLRLCTPRPDKTREVIVSFLPRSLLGQIEQVCRETGYRLNRLVTSADALFGAFQRQMAKPVADPCLMLQVGYSRVNLMVVRGLEIVSVRSLLTGCLRELENLLFSGFSLSKADVWQILRGSKVSGIPAIDDTIRTNRLELMTHIGSLFSELRSKKLLTEKSVFYISNSMMDEPDLALMIAERFGIQVDLLTGLLPDELCETNEDRRSVWLNGAYQPAVPNLVPQISRTMTQFTLPPRTAAIAVLVLALAPLPFLNILKFQTNRDLEYWKARHLPIQTLVDEFSAAAAEQQKLVELAKEITGDIDRRGIATRLTRHLTEHLPPFSRLERLEVNLKDNKVLVTGYTVDTETALRYLDQIKLFAELDEPELTLGDIESRRIRFDIMANIVRKG